MNDIKSTSTPPSPEEVRSQKLAEIWAKYSSKAQNFLAQCDQLEIVDRNDVRKYLEVALRNSGRKIDGVSKPTIYIPVLHLPYTEELYQVFNRDDLLLLMPMHESSFHIEKLDTPKGYSINPKCLHLAMVSVYYAGHETYLTFRVAQQEWLFIWSGESSSWFA